MNHGKIFAKFTFVPALPFFFSLWVRINARQSVIGIIANVRVSFTVTALSNVALPKPYMLSQVEAQAVTDDVSFTAVPAKMPKDSPDVVSNPIAVPNAGNMSAANTLKKKITLIDWAISSSDASTQGAAAAIAEPPQMDDPTPTNTAVFELIFNTFPNTNAIINAVAIVDIMIGRD